GCEPACVAREYAPIGRDGVPSSGPVPPHPRPPLFPYTTLFRSQAHVVGLGAREVLERGAERLGGHHAQVDGEAVLVPDGLAVDRSEEHTSELQSRSEIVCRLLRAKKKRPSCRCA